MSIILIFISFFPVHCFAQALDDHQEKGWYWYEEAIKEENNDTVIPLTIEAAQAQLETLKKDMEGKKALALMNPTEENLKNYIRLQYDVSLRADTFANIWQKVIIKNPELDHTIKYPTNAVARRVYHQENENNQKNGVDDFVNRYGLFFFFRSNCPYCHQFSPIVKMFEEEYGLTVIPVSLDGKGLPEYPNPKPDNGIAEKLNIDIVPAIVAVDPKSSDIIPIAYGLVSAEELAYRINLMNHKTGANSK